MESSELERIPDAARREIVIDDGLDRDSPSAPAWITPVALFAGLFLTLVLSRLGVGFFFLPIILPFGFGGGRLLKQFLPPPRRVLRFGDGVLWLAAEGPWRTTVVDRLEVASGVFVALGTTGVFVAGLEDARIRIVSEHGALAIPVRGGERARLLRRDIEDMLGEEGVPELDRETPLQGDVWVEPFEDGEQIEWSSGGPSSGFFSTGSATSLRVTPQAWALRVRSQGRPVVSTGGPGRLEARLVEVDRGGPLGASVARDASLLELSAEGESVAEVGAELSEPELRFIRARVERATRLSH